MIFADFCRIVFHNLTFLEKHGDFCYNDIYVKIQIGVKIQADW